MLKLQSFISTKKLLLVLFIGGIAHLSAAQEIKKELKHFTKIVASPKINVILQQGERESIRLAYSNINESKINIEIKGKTLQLYLDNARKIEKKGRKETGTPYGTYENASLTAYITYKELEYLEIRGEQRLTCYDPLEADVFTLKAYGENEITLASLKTEYFKASLHGENVLHIKNGKVLEQKYRVYGENKIDTQKMRSEYTSTNIFGEGKLRINSTEEVRINAFGEPHIYVDGGATVNKRLIFGKAEIYQR